jgi:hypothetical protein
MSYSETAFGAPLVVPGLAYTPVAVVKPRLLKPFGVVIVEGHDTPFGVAVPGWPVPAGLGAAVAPDAANPARARTDAAVIANLRMQTPPSVKGTFGL